MPSLFVSPDSCHDIPATRVQIYDAHTMSPEPLAKIALPQRVPQGLHGTFVTRQQLHQQALYAQQGGRQH